MTATPFKPPLVDPTEVVMGLLAVALIISDTLLSKINNENDCNTIQTAASGPY